jgi:hypothetical protein
MLIGNGKRHGCEKIKPFDAASLQSQFVIFLGEIACPANTGDWIARKHLDRFSTTIEFLEFDRSIATKRGGFPTPLQWLEAAFGVSDRWLHRFGALAFFAGLLAIRGDSSGQAGCGENSYGEWFGKPVWLFCHGLGPVS